MGRRSGLAARVRQRRRSLSAAAADSDRAVLLGLVFVGFISLGLPDGLLGVAWPSIRQAFDTPLDALGALLLTTAAGYLTASLSSGWIVARLGVGMLLALSSLSTALGLLGYALAPSWLAIVALGLVAGLGAGAIDAGLNAYVALHHSARLLNWLHASFGLGAASGPLIMVTVLDAGHSWRWGYAIVGLVQLVLAVSFLATASRWPRVEPAAMRASDRPALRSPRVGRSSLAWLSVGLFFVYTGLETAAGQWPYTLFTEARGAAPQAAGLWVSIFWGGLAFGRVVFGFVVERVEPVVLLRGAMLVVLGGAALIWLNLSRELSFLGLGLMGLAAAPIFPSLIAITPQRLGPDQASSVIGYQVGAASLGMAIVPGLAGIAAERAGLEAIAPFLVVTAAVTILLHELVVALAGREARERGRPGPAAARTRD